jgi:hypothetical protein
LSSANARRTCVAYVLLPASPMPSGKERPSSTRSRQDLDSSWSTDFALSACCSIAPLLREHPFATRSAVRRNRSWLRRDACSSAMSVSSSSVTHRKQVISTVWRCRSMRAVIDGHRIWT